MSAIDTAARATVARERRQNRRLATLDMLSRSIAENLPKGLPGAMAVPIAESRSSTTQIAGGITYGFSNSTPANHFPHHYSLYGGDWSFYSTSYLVGINCHNGNGTDPAAVPVSKPSTNVRFATYADRFEVYAQNYLGFRVKVNGKYCKTGAYGVSALNGDSASGRFFLFDFTGTEFAGTGLKLVELQAAFDEFRFGGVRVPVAYTVHPWPQAFPLKAALHGDSMPGTVSDPGTEYRTSLHGFVPAIMQALTGISDIWMNSIGSTGYIADGSGTRSNWIEQAPVDFAGKDFDIVWGLGSRNDSWPGSSAYQAIVKNWIEIVLADNPDAIIFLSGPIFSTTTDNANATVQLMQSAIREAAASYPQNCAFIETCGNSVTADPWIFGSGKVDATTGNGNADMVRGGDGVHLSVFGHQYLGTRIVTETAKVIPLLASRIRNGVIEGLNDTDIA
ncbi:MAG TPA: SGNH/GDSL hydrolase family protein [Sphingomonadaceae bacterium]|nr:SGNH/GDSL hydrolase family protein [Sphingomonadaceae bacterium]